MRRDVDRIAVDRLTAFTADLNRDAYRERFDFQVEFAVTDDPVPFAEIGQLEFKPLRAGEIWGREWQNAWFRLGAEVPAHLRGAELAFLLDFDGEALLYDRDGRPGCSISSGSALAANFRRDVVRGFQENGRIDFYVEAVASQLWGINVPSRQEGSQPDFGSYTARLLSAAFAGAEEELEAFRFEFAFTLNLYQAQPAGGYRSRRLLRILNDAMDAYAYDPANAPLARTKLAEALKAPADSVELKVSAVGHAHIDTAWLWRLKECRRKCLRTFANQLDLLRRYPDYVFGASQALHYQMIREYAPELYQEIRKYVAEGRWELLGGAWVESDLNVPNGESLIRQHVIGKNFLRREFGLESFGAWFPDCFGFPAALPQIFSKCRCGNFFTIKLIAGQHNDFPHRSFIWKGVDGSEVTAHYSPSPEGYVCLMRPETVIQARENFKENDYLDEILMPFGVGDGGGGPRDEDVRRVRLEADLAGVPRVRQARSDEFFARLRAQREILPQWQGEMYFERHRGCQTSQARLKHDNRALENALREVEYLYSLLPAGQYPRRELQELWEMLLTYQFHDILPGSSIHEVYEDGIEDFGRSLQACAGLLRRGAEQLLYVREDAMVVWNLHSFPVSERVRLPQGWTGASCGGQPLAVQRDADGCFARLDLPALSSVEVIRSEAPAAAVETSAVPVLENAFIRYEFNELGEVVRAFDKELNREWLAGNGNRFRLYRDVPVFEDAWDLDYFYQQTPLPGAESAAALRVEHGELESVLHSQVTVGGAEIRQCIRLAHDGRQLEFATRVLHWQRAHQVLRVEFPTSVQAENASYEIQWAAVSRPNHRNTSWDLAKFENPTQGYIDLSDHSGGTAVFSDYKYAGSALDGVIGLTLLRATCFPDPTADRGDHEFRYAFYPHPAHWSDSDLPERAAAFRHPAVRLEGFSGTLAAPVRPADAREASLEVLKRAEESDGLVIRLAERHGKVARVTLALDGEIAQAQECDMLEWTDCGEALPARDGMLDIVLKPFEIKTLKLQ